VPKR